EIGRAEVPVGEPRGFSVLDAQRATTLRTWVTTLIPARGDRPDAADVGAAEYVDATVFLVPALRPALIQAIDRLERSANDQRHKAFSECSAEDREACCASSRRSTRAMHSTWSATSRTRLTTAIRACWPRSRR